MNKKTLLSQAVSLALVSGLAFTASNAFARENEENKVDEIEKITVTGSRIAKTELSTPTPVLVLGQQEIARFGTPDLGSVLAELPAIGATNTLSGNAGSNANAGQSSADLRRLGANRSLVLVNGKRHVAGSPGSAQVDLSTIPAVLIERIEIITGGASAIYGSDAVTGVINVVLKEDFEGLELNATASGSTEGVGAKNHTFSIVSGASSDKGNVTFFAGVERIEETMSADIRQLDNWGSYINTLDEGEDDGIPDQLRSPNIGSEMINDTGVMNPFGGDRFTFDRNGNVIEQCKRSQTNSFAFGQLPAGCTTGFFTEEYENIYPSVERFYVGSTMNYELSDQVNFFADFKYNSAEIAQQFQPSFRFGNISIDVEKNAFLSDYARNRLGGSGVVPMAKFFDELGNRSAANERDMFRVVGGFDGYFTLGDTNFDWELFYVYGESNNIRVTENDLIPGNFAAAVNSMIDPDTGEAVCVDPSSATVDAGNCVAYNPFGFAQASQAARDWVSADVTRKDQITQEVFGGSIATDTEEFFSLQGGPIGFAAGFEYREESYSTITDELTKSGALLGAATPDEFGEYDVTEGFVEVSLPILADVDFAKELTIDAAYRTADYSHAGTADAWKVGLMYAPIEQLRLRATFGEAVRAPNLSEAFSPQSPGFGRVSDPCDADNINDDPDRAGNCAALGIPAGFQANDNVSIDTISGGNPDLFSETSTSTTYGLVWVPEFIENLTVTVDYYDIEIKDAIISVTAQNIADNCVDATGGPDELYCSAIDRDPTTKDIDLVRSGLLNAAALNVSGIESEINYRMSLESMDLPGDVSFKLFVSKLIELEQFEFQDRPDEINVETGEVGDPELQVRLSTTYVLDDLVVNWTMRTIDRVVTYDVSPNGGSPEDLDPYWIPTIVTHDVSGSYMFSDDVSVNFGMRNVFDKLPPAYTVNAQYDIVGRRIFTGVNVKF
ncbi:TonB-dependent receptor domain-containing protein [Psychrosphaera aestuarii]|uniref:TonB-dependent receptor domain-containing protein n=1 Tax=Psychrosphaera aestuarii TaxID=1266052 RepID=UPI001B326555|nr:TonB-dependent receptor [Psychrosphaera aestuarii]